MKKYAKCRNDNEQQNLVIPRHRHITDYRSWEKSVLNLIIHKIMNSKGKNSNAFCLPDMEQYSHEQYPSVLLQFCN